MMQERIALAKIASDQKVADAKIDSDDKNADRRKGFKDKVFIAVIAAALGLVVSAITSSVAYILQIFSTGCTKTRPNQGVNVQSPQRDDRR